MTPSSPNNAHLLSPPNRKPCRRFVSRSKHKRRVQRKNRTPPTPLLTNLSSLQLPKSCETLLNKGLNFVPTPTTVNTTLFEANIQRFNRKIRWMEYFHSNSPDDDTNSDTTASPNIFKHLKYNFPPSSHNPLRSLLNFLDSIHDDILHSELNKVHPM